MRRYVPAILQGHRTEWPHRNSRAWSPARRVLCTPRGCGQAGRPPQSPLSRTAQPWPRPAPTFARRLESNCPWLAEVAAAAWLSNHLLRRNCSSIRTKGESIRGGAASEEPYSLVSRFQAIRSFGNPTMEFHKADALFVSQYRRSFSTIAPEECPFGFVTICGENCFLRREHGPVLKHL